MVDWVGQGEDVGAGQRLISASGRSYSTVDNVKVGIKTRGRGFWVGRDRREEVNPDVDDPKLEGTAQLIIPVGGDDGFDDDKDPYVAMRRNVKLKNVVNSQVKQAQQMVEAAWGRDAFKAIANIGDENMDLLSQDPEKMSEDDLLKSVDVVKIMLANTQTAGERSVITNYAGRLYRAVNRLMQTHEAVAKAAVEASMDKKDAKEPSLPPSKAQETKVNKKGKVAYKYPKKNKGKGPNSDGGPGDKAKAAAKQQQQPQQAQPADQQQPDQGPITPPAADVDVDSFCMQIGVGPGQMQRFASKKTKQEFVTFVGNLDVVKNKNIQPSVLGKVYDQLVSPQPQPADPKAGAQPQMPNKGTPQQVAQPGRMPKPANPLSGRSPAAKSIVVFNGATLSRKTLAMLDMLKSHRAETVDDIRKCFQSHFACDEPTSYTITRTLLNKWERKGLLTIYPPEA